MYYTLTNSTLSFVLEGTEQILALRAKIKIDKSDIIDMKWYSAFSDWNTLLIRMPGSYMPKWVMAGSYWTDDGWDFVFAKKPKGMLRPILHNVIVINTKKDKFKRVIVEASQSDADDITSWWST